MRSIIVLILSAAIPAAALAAGPAAPDQAPTQSSAASAGAAWANSKNASAEREAATVATVAMALLFARRIGITASEKSPTAEIRKLSQDVATRAGSLFVEVEAAAAAAGLPVPRTLDAAYAEKAELLESSFDTQFEHEYLGMQIAAHSEALELVTTKAGLAGLPQFASLSGKIADALGGQLAGLRQAKQQLPSM